MRAPRTITPVEVRDKFLFLFLTSNNVKEFKEQIENYYKDVLGIPEVIEPFYIEVLYSIFDKFYSEIYGVHNIWEHVNRETFIPIR